MEWSRKACGKRGTDKKKNKYERSGLLKLSLIG